MRYYKVLFIPGNVYHVRMFSRVAKKLKGEVLAISLEGYGEKGRTGIERALRENGIRFRRIQDYRKEDPEFILREEKPDVVVVLNDIDPGCLYFVRSANRLGIPTLLIAEGIVVDAPFKRIGLRYILNVVKNVLLSGNIVYSTKLLIRKVSSKLSGHPEPDYGKYGSECTRIAVWGEYSKKFFESKGVPSERITITGNPLMDDIFWLKPKTSAVHKQLGLPSYAKLLVYASCNPIDIQYWTEEETAHLVRLLNRIILKLENCFLLIRPHPTEPSERYLNFLQKEDTSKTFVSKRENLYDLLASCDILITEASVVGSEAAVIGKPVIIVNLTGKPYLNRYYPKLLVDEGVAIEVRKEDELDSSIRRLLKSQKDLVKNRQKFIRKYFYKLDGMSSQRVASLIEKLARKRGG